MSMQWALYYNFDFFDLSIGIADLFGAGQPYLYLKGKSPYLINVFLAFQVTLYLLASIHGQKAGIF